MSQNNLEINLIDVTWRFYVYNRMQAYTAVATESFVSLLCCNEFTFLFPRCIQVLQRGSVPLQTYVSQRVPPGIQHSKELA